MGACAQQQHNKEKQHTTTQQGNNRKQAEECVQEQNEYLVRDRDGRTRAGGTDDKPLDFLNDLHQPTTTRNYHIVLCVPISLP